MQKIIERQEKKEAIKEIAKEIAKGNMKENAVENGVEVNSGAQKKIVVPGDLVGNAPLKAGSNVFAKNGQLFSSVVGLLNESAERVSVVALEGKYVPLRNDVIIGIVVGEKHAGYDVEINSFFQSFILKMGLRQELAIGSLFSAIVSNVNEVNQIDIDRARPFYGGELLVVSPVKVPRIIGKNESMLNVLRNGTKCQIFVGKNGFIWVNDGNIKLLQEALHKIESESHLPNLTNNINAFLENKTLHELKTEIKKNAKPVVVHKVIESEEKAVEQKLDSLAKEKEKKAKSKEEIPVVAKKGFFDEIAQSIKKGL